MKNEKKSVCLWGLDQLALIILCKSNVEYYNQCGGNSCVNKEDEGILTILFDDTHAALNEIEKYCLNFHYLTEEAAAGIDDIFRKHSCTSYLTVDRTRLRESAEAWIYVDIVSDREKFIKEIEENKFDYDIVGPAFDFRGFVETKGVLTWCNSD